MRIPVRALEDRELRLLVTSRGVSTLGSAMAEVALAFAVLQIGSATDLGLVLLAREIPTVIFLLLGGVWADRISRKTLLVWSDATRAAAQAVAAALLLTGAASVWSLAALQVAFGLVGAVARPAYAGFVQQAVTPDRLQEANALTGLASSVTRVAGPALGAVLVAAASPGWAIAADGASFAASALLVAAMHVRPASVALGKSILGDLRDGWREFVSRTWVWTMVVSFGLFQLTLFPALLVLGPTVAKEDLGGAGAWGTILSLGAVGSVLGGLVAYRIRVRRPLVVTALLSTPVAGTLALLAVQAPVWAIAGWNFLAGLCLTIDDTLWFTTLQRKIPDHAISRISSFDWFGSVVLNPVGYALVGPLAASIGVSAVLAACALLNAAVGVGLLLVPAVRELRWETAGETG